MKMRTAMKSTLGICEIREKGCLASELPQPVELIYVGPEEKATCVCTNCMAKKLKEGAWAMWYQDQA